MMMVQPRWTVRLEQGHEVFPVMLVEEAPPIDQVWWPIELINSSSLLELIVPTVLLVTVGQRFVAAFPRCRLWGQRVAALVLIAYVGERLHTTQPTNGSVLLHLILRGLMLSGLVLGSAWCVFPPFATCGNLLSRATSLVLRFPQKMMDWVRSISSRLCSSIRPKRKLSHAQRSKLEQEAGEAELRRQSQVRLLAEQQQRERARQLDERKRRDDARFACQVFYDRHRNALREKFSPKQLSNYFERYLADSLAAEEVEKRAEQLKEMILNVAEGNRGSRPRFSNLGEIRDHFRQQQQSVLDSDFSKDIKDTLISDLAREEIRTIREFRQT